MQSGYVTTTELGPAIGEMMRKQGYTFSGLAEIVGCDESTIRKMAVGQYDHLKFDFVDQILCELNATHLWHGEFKDLYEKVEFRQTCQSPVCNRTFREKVVRHGVKIYCSRRCSILAWKIEQGQCTGNRLRDECWRGHKFTPENTAIRPNGSRLCRTCARERRREKMKDPAYRERQQGYVRKHREKKAAA